MHSSLNWFGSHTQQTMYRKWETEDHRISINKVVFMKVFIKYDKQEVGVVSQEPRGSCWVV